MKVTYLSSSNVWRADSGWIQTDSLWFLDSRVVWIQSKFLEYLSVFGVDFHQGSGKSVGTTFRLTVNTTSNYSEIKVVLSSSLCENEWLQSFNSMICISEVVSDIFSIERHNTSSMFHIHFGLRRFPFSCTIILLILIKLRLLNSMQDSISCFKWEVIKISSRVNFFVFEIIFKNHMFVFSKDMENLTLWMTIQVEGNSIKWKLNTSAWWNVKKLFLWDGLFVKALLWIVISCKDLFNVKSVP